MSVAVRISLREFMEMTLCNSTPSCVMSLMMSSSISLKAVVRFLLHGPDQCKRLCESTSPA